MKANPKLQREMRAKLVVMRESESGAWRMTGRVCRVQASLFDMIPSPSASASPPHPVPISIPIPSLDCGRRRAASGEQGNRGAVARRSVLQWLQCCTRVHVPRVGSGTPGTPYHGERLAEQLQQSSGCGLDADGPNAPPIVRRNNRSPPDSESVHGGRGRHARGQALVGLSIHRPYSSALLSPLSSLL